MGMRQFLRLLLNKNWRPSVPDVDDSLAKTAKDALHIRGGAPGGSGGVGFSGTGDAYNRIGEGHQNYAKSFKKKKG